MVCIKLSKDFLVKGGSRGIHNAHIVNSTELVNFLAHGVKTGLVLANALNAHLCLLVDRVTDCPFDDSEVDACSLAQIDAVVENAVVEKMAHQADGETLQVGALRLVATLNTLVCFSKCLDIFVVGGELAASRDDAVADFLWQIILLSEGAVKVAANDCLDEWHQLTTEMVRRFLRHLSW